MGNTLKPVTNGLFQQEDTRIVLTEQDIKTAQYLSLGDYSLGYFVDYPTALEIVLRLRAEENQPQYTQVN